MNKILFFVLIVFFVLSCQKEETSPSMISEELKPYVDRFFDEAESRGISLPENIDALISNDISACGEGHSPEFNGRFTKPTILINELCWENRDDVTKEYLVFHELGHALLNRIHIDEILPNGYSKSIMCAGNDFNCSDLPDYQFCLDYREYYINELFDVATESPEWSSRDWNVLSDIFSDLNSTFTTDWQVFTNCSSNSLEVAIDSTNQNRPSDYSLRLYSNCEESAAIRKRIGIDNPSSAEAIRIKCDLYHNLIGDGFRIDLVVKNRDNSFSTFNRTIPKEIINSSNSIEDFTLQAECLTPNADSLIINFVYFDNTGGEVFIGNLDIQLME